MASILSWFLLRSSNRINVVYFKEGAMRLRRILGSILILISFLLTISGCELYKGPYTFRQDKSNVEKIEVCSYERNSGTMTSLVRISDDQIDVLLGKLSRMECSEYVMGNVPRQYGDAVIGIYYLNGEIELIGITNIGWITPDGERNLTRYSFDWNEMRELILSLVGEDDLPELRK